MRLAICFCLLTSIATAGPYSIEIAIAIAEQEQPVVKDSRQVVTMYTAPNCRACRVFQADIKKNKQLGSLFSQQYKLKIENAPKDVKRAPTFVIGQRRYVGYSNPKNFINWLNRSKK